MSQEPLVVCAYGWGRVFKLYQDSVDVDGTRYELIDLVQVRVGHRRVLNIPSVRLELRFREKDVVLRGIASIDDATKIVEYLNTYCSDASPQSHRSRAHQAPQLETSNTSFASRYVDTSLSNDEVCSVFSDDGSMQELAQAITTPVEAPRWLRDLDKDIQQTRRRQGIHALHSQSQYGFDVEKLAKHLQADTMPSVAVPLRLLEAERAHYSTRATLCGEPVSRSEDYVYPAKDHGTLIVTNKRLIYIGRKSQLILDYVHLVNVSRLHGALAFSTDHWSRREIFEMGRPLECAMYLDSVLRKFHRQPAKSELPAVPQSIQTPTIRQTYTERNTQARHAIYTRHTTGMRPIKQVTAIADIDTLPLSTADSIQVEVSEESRIYE